MKDPKLVVPDVKYKVEYLKAVIEDMDNKAITRLPKPKEGQSFENFVAEQAEIQPREKSRVPATTLWLIDEGVFIGRLSVRHELNDNLRKVGGHVGYWIRPTKRRMGYGKKILKMGLEKIKSLGIKNVLITCDIDNLPSRKIIESHGGKLQDTIEHSKEHPKLHRFWINL